MMEKDNEAEEEAEQCSGTQSLGTDRVGGVALW